jgi:hypothetical protein
MILVIYYWSNLFRGGCDASIEAVDKPPCLYKWTICTRFCRGGSPTASRNRFVEAACPENHKFRLKNIKKLILGDPIVARAPSLVSNYSREKHAQPQVSLVCPLTTPPITHLYLFGIFVLLILPSSNFQMSICGPKRIQIKKLLTTKSYNFSISTTLVLFFLHPRSLEIFEFQMWEI